MNNIKLAGKVETDPVFDYESHGRKFFSFFLSCKRYSGTADVLPCVAGETIADKISKGSKIEINGYVKSRDACIDGKHRLLIYVYVSRLHEYTADYNIASIYGHSCKESIYRETPFGRRICDLVVSVDKHEKKGSYYIPCIFWGGNAVRASCVGRNEMISTSGRLQSREYIKRHDDGSWEIRTAYELSSCEIEVKGERNEN